MTKKRNNEIGIKLQSQLSDFSRELRTLHNDLNGELINELDIALNRDFINEMYDLDFELFNEINKISI